MQKNNKYLTIIGRILFILFFCGAIFFIYTNPARKQTILNQTIQQTNTDSAEIKQMPDSQKNQEVENYKFKYTYIIDIQGYVKNLIFSVPIPSNSTRKQTISNLKISYQPDKVYNDGVNEIGEFKFENLNNEKIEIIIEGDAALVNYDLKTAKTINENNTKEKDLSKYLKPELYIESNDSLIKSTANKLKGKTTEETIQKIYEYTQKILTYTHLPGISGAKRALQERKGECSEYSAVMIALCRANGIPARVVTGNIAREKNNKHNWVEVYFDKYGWVTFDPTVMATVVNIYNNGKLVRQEKRLEPFGASAKYIISARNQFSPYYISYKIADNRYGKVAAQEIIQINKVK